MTYEEGRIEFNKLIRAYNAKIEDITSRAKQEGRWRPGLDSNRNLFTEVNEKYRRLHAELVAQVK